jgi:hypothetical protein
VPARQVRSARFLVTISNTFLDYCWIPCYFFDMHVPCSEEDAVTQSPAPKFSSGQNVVRNGKVGTFHFFNPDGKTAWVSFPTGLDKKVPVDELKTYKKREATQTVLVWQNPVQRKSRARERML